MLVLLVLLLLVLLLLLLLLMLLLSRYLTAVVAIAWEDVVEPESSPDSSLVGVPK
jgi:hypothetical protein